MDGKSWRSFMATRYWLVKSDPDTFGWKDLLASPGRTTCWDGVRNYQARNYLRDEMRSGDGVLFYHSQSDKAVPGVAVVAKEGYPDPTQFDRRSRGYDPESNREEPRWYAVDLKADREFTAPVTLNAMRAEPALRDMTLLRRGSRLSVMPVTAAEWRAILRLGGLQ
jgi:predicted RNA-binding protein with PUA-like domain